MIGCRDGDNYWVDRRVIEGWVKGWMKEWVDD